MYVYIRSEERLWTVGFYDPSGDWHPDSDYNDPEQAAERVAWLNGSGKPEYNVTVVPKLWNIPVEDLKLEERYPDGPPKIDF